MGTRIVDFYKLREPLQEFKLESPKLKYHIKLYDRISILKGLSASGKTTIVNLINKYMKSKEDEVSNKIKLETTCQIITEVTSSFLNTVSIDNSTYLIILDEDDFLVKKGILQHIIKKLQKDRYLLLIARYEKINIDCSVSAIYKLTLNHRGYLVNKPIFNIYNKYLSHKKLHKDSNITIVITEDSNSGAELIKHLFKNSKIISSKTNTQIIPTINKTEINEEDYLFVVADMVNYARFIDSLMLLETKYNIIVPNIESIEWLILISLTDFKAITDKILFNNFKDFFLNSKYLNKEKLYEDTLREICCFYNTSSKNNNSNRIINSINFKNLNSTKLDNCTYSKSKLGEYFKASRVLKEILNELIEEKGNESQDKVNKDIINVRWN